MIGVRLSSRDRTSSPAEWAGVVRGARRSGVDYLSVPDHVRTVRDPMITAAMIPSFGWSGPVAIEVLAAGTRDPIRVAHALSSVMSTCENAYWIGIGTGYRREDYTALGIERKAPTHAWPDTRAFVQRLQATLGLEAGDDEAPARYPLTAAQRERLHLFVGAYSAARPAWPDYPLGELSLRWTGRDPLEPVAGLASRVRQAKQMFDVQIHVQLKGAYIGDDWKEQAAAEAEGEDAEVDLLPAAGHFLAGSIEECVARLAVLDRIGVDRVTLPSGSWTAIAMMMARHRSDGRPDA